MTDLATTFELEDDLEDFESEDLEEVEATGFDYLDSMWKGHKFGAADTLANDLVTAHGMVQSFVNAFARDGHYAVNFGDVSTAGTDMDTKRVVITPAPVADTKLTVEQIGRILTGLAVHEVSHTRYGRKTYEAVQKRFWGNHTAYRLSNILDDIRIERRFVADYPGYAGIFEPTLDYVGAAGLKPGQLIPVSHDQPTNLLISATRYPKFADWSRASAITLAERDWWINWAARGSREDSPKRHAEFIREALEHIAANQVRPPSLPQPKAQQESGDSKDQADEQQAGEAGDEEPTESGEAGTGGSTDAAETGEQQDAPGAASEDTGEAADEAGGDEAGAAALPAASSMTDGELNAATKDLHEIAELPDESGSQGVERAALKEGADRADVKDLRESADQIIENARNLEGDGHGNLVDVALSLRGIASGGEKLGPSQQAARYIANAILRSRTGNQAITPFKKHGRLDNGGLQRLALGDSRVFEKRRAPSPGKYLVWLMVDCSASMDGDPIAQAAQVAHSVAAASLSVPTARVAVWGWSNPFRPSTAGTGVARAWQTGGDLKDIFRLSGLETGGTPDATTTAWAARAIKRAARPDEQPVLVILSDGCGDGNMGARVQEARDMGVAVYSVALGYGISEKDQEARFGRGNFVPWAGSIIATARPLAELFARITSGQGGKR